MWQSENTLLTLRIRGKQCYLPYKLDLFNVKKITNSNICVGDGSILSRGVWVDGYNKFSPYNKFSLQKDFYGNKVFLNKGNKFFFKKHFLI